MRHRGGGWVALLSGGGGTGMLELLWCRPRRKVQGSIPKCYVLASFERPNCTFTPKALKDAQSQNSSKRNAVQNISRSYRSCDLAFPFKGPALFAYYTLVVEASAAADAEPQDSPKFGQ